MSAVPQLNIAWPELSHYSAKPVTRVRSREQPGKEPGWAWQHKPHGLWLSVDGADGWKAWCVDESYCLDNLAYRYRVTLKDPGALLWIATADELLDFTQRYDKPHAFSDGHKSRHGSYIDWPRVAADWPGIVIAPYCWTLRLDQRTSWYYGWDCASGCLWDHRMIANMTLTTGDKTP